MKLIYALKLLPKKKEFQLISPDETYFTYKMKMNHLMKKKILIKLFAFISYLINEHNFYLQKFIYTASPYLDVLTGGYLLFSNFFVL